MTDNVEVVAAGAVVIVGAGPCGIGCAREFHSLGHTDYVVLEERSTPGGLASSVVDPAGFTWDLGGHVVFSHYGEFDRLLESVMGDDLERHERSSFVRIDDVWVPYPLQNNLHHLPQNIASDALIDLIEAQGRGDRPDAGSPAPTDFATWMVDTFGETICQRFMRPYNEKVWATPATQMTAAWISERVSVVDWRQAVRTVAGRRDELAWGPNNTFAFPVSGGTGEIFRRAATSISDSIRYNSEIVTVDLVDRSLTTAAGEQHHFDSLVWTGPLDQLVSRLPCAPPDVKAAADALVHNSVTMVGVGYSAPTEDTGSWFYFPDPSVPFYRATNFGKYAAANVPGGRSDLYSAWMTEVASSPSHPLNSHRLAERVDASLRESGLVAADAVVASIHVEQIPYGYPVPTLGRDAALGIIQPWLMRHGVFARGRFGAWRYELGNMDHAVKMGVDAARCIVNGTAEEAWSV